MYGVPDFYQNDNVKKGTGMQWRHQVVSDLPSPSVPECDCESALTLSETESSTD